MAAAAEKSDAGAGTADDDANAAGISKEAALGFNGTNRGKERGPGTVESGGCPGKVDAFGLGTTLSRRRGSIEVAGESVLTIWCIFRTPNEVTGGGSATGSVPEGELVCPGCWWYGWELGAPALAIGAPSGDDMGSKDESRVAGGNGFNNGRCGCIDV